MLQKYMIDKRFPLEGIKDYEKTDREDNKTEKRIWQFTHGLYI